jgi:hypothetical protein
VVIRKVPRAISTWCLISNKLRTKNLLAAVETETVDRGNWCQSQRALELRVSWEDPEGWINIQDSDGGGDFGADYGS